MSHPCAATKLEMLDKNCTRGGPSNQSVIDGFWRLPSCDALGFEWDDNPRHSYSSYMFQVLRLRYTNVMSKLDREFLGD
jgi:hypothetical protein